MVRRNKETANDAAIREYQKVLGLLKKVEHMAISAAGAADAHPGDWRYHGDLQHIRETLEGLVGK